MKDLVLLNMTYKRLYTIIFSSILLIIVVFASLQCKDLNAAQEWKKYSSEYIKKHLNTNIEYPERIPMPDFKTPPKIKILFAVDMGCSACLLKFAFWNNFCEEMFRKYDIEVSIVAFVSGIDIEIEKRVENLWNRPWVYDADEEFIIKNDLSDDRFQSVLVDQNDVIKLIGNPIHNPDLAQLYEETIFSYVKKM